MYRLGHLGVVAVAYAPIGAYLLGELRPILALAGFVTVIVATMLPDADMRLPGVPHRGPTHTPLFAAMSSLALFFVLLAVRVPIDLASILSGSVALAVLAHILADAITPMGVPHPLWPLRNRRIRLPPGVLASNPIANVLLFLVGAAVTVAVIFQSRAAIVQAILQTIGADKRFGGVEGPQSPAEWRAFAKATMEMISTTGLEILRFEYIGAIVVAVVVLVGIAVLSR